MPGLAKLRALRLSILRRHEPRGGPRHGAGATALAVLLTGCQQQSATPDAQSTPTSLEAAAIAAGIVADPAASDPTGLYTRDSDQLCIVPSATAFRIGMHVEYGDTHACSGTGIATRAGETLHVELTSAPGCAFDAQFEGDRIAIPGALPDACQKACTERASLAGLSVERISDSPADAATLRDGRGRLLCGDR